MRRELTAYASFVGVVVLGLAAMAALPAPPEPSETPGSRDYGLYCAPCHGASGRGDGVLVPHMATRPSDLTLLSRRNGGVFPSARVSHAVAGPARSHGPMPAWADAFRESADESGAEGVKRRIQAIVGHVESLQAKEPPAVPGGAMALCTFSNVSLAGLCTETVPLEPGGLARGACSSLLACLNDSLCIETYCQATPIRQGWALVSARRATAQP